MGVVAVRSPGTLSAARHIIVRGLLCSGGNPLATWRHDRNDLLHDITAARPVAPRSKYPTAARISVLASSGPANSQSS